MKSPEMMQAACLHRSFDWETFSQYAASFLAGKACRHKQGHDITPLMQGQEASTKAIQDDIDDQYRSLRRDVQHGRAELVRRHKSPKCMLSNGALKDTVLMFVLASR